MTRPKVYIYNPEHHEIIVTEGITGNALAQLSFNLETQRVTIIVHEGVLNQTNDAIESITRGSQQFDLDPQEVIDFYSENKTEMDALNKRALEWVAEKTGKTGLVNS